MLGSLARTNMKLRSTRLIYASQSVHVSSAVAQRYSNLRFDKFSIKVLLNTLCIAKVRSDCLTLDLIEFRKTEPLFALLQI